MQSRDTDTDVSFDGLANLETQYRFQADSELLSLLPRSAAVRLMALPVKRDGSSVVVAMADVEDIFALDELEQTFGSPIKPIQCLKSTLDQHISNTYRRSEELRQIAKILEAELSLRKEMRDDNSSLEGSEEDSAPVMKLLQNIFADALELGSSDIHLEPESAAFRVRQRVDGILQEQRVNNISIFSALVIRLKLMSDLDIAEKRLPQEGRFLMSLDKQDIEVRIATMPTQHGESITMRLLVKSMRTQNFSELGLSAPQISQLRNVLNDPHGMILVVGPTGSGKSTTLNAMLNLLDSPERKIFTVEDPIESDLQRATQVQVNRKVGLDYSDILKVTLRHDPDVIMVGEMRDQETARMATRAAMTGHLMLSTMHCNTAASALPRLVDMGVEPYLISSSLRVVVAQRLMRRVCSHCATPATPTEQQQSWIKSNGYHLTEGYQEGLGCESCNGTGLSGRVGIYEVLELNENLVNQMLNINFEPSSNAVLKNNSLFSAAVERANSGQTTVAEIQRVLGSSDY